MEAAFRSSEIAFFKESFILASINRFSFNYKLCAFIQSFFLLVDNFLPFSIPNSRAVFPASGNGFFIECFMCLFMQSKLCASGNHYSN